MHYDGGCERSEARVDMPKCSTLSKAAGGQTLSRHELLIAFAQTRGVIARTPLLAVAIGPVTLSLAAIIWFLDLVRPPLIHGAQTGMHLLLGKAAEVVEASRFPAVALGTDEKREIFYK